VSNLNYRRRRVRLLTVTWNASRELFYLEQKESEDGGVKLLYHLLIMQTVANHQKLA